METMDTEMLEESQEANTNKLTEMPQNEEKEKVRKRQTPKTPT